MFKKIMLAISITVVISLLVSSLAFASGGMPAWQTAFDPGNAGAHPPTYQIFAVEEFRDNLYAAVSDNIFETATIRSPAVQVFRSADGKNWQPAGELGFGLGTATVDCYDGTPWTAYYNESWDMTVFKGNLYVGLRDTCYERPGMIMRSSDGTTWEKAFSADVPELTWFEGETIYYAEVHKFGVFDGMLYVNVLRFDPDIQFLTTTILRSPSGDPGTWEKVVDLLGNSPGSFHVFNEALYMASDGVLDPSDWSPAPDQIWRTFDGKNWEKVVSDGFGNSGSDGLGGFANYKGYLYVGEGAPDNGGGQVWRSPDGVKWEKVITGGMGNPDNYKIDGLVVYQGLMYAYSVNWVQGGTMYRSQDGLNWETVSQPGWGNPDYITTHLESAQAVFKDQLYLGMVGTRGALLVMAHP